MAQWGKKVWMKHGALGYYECLGDDLKGMPGCGTFTKLPADMPFAAGRMAYGGFRTVVQG